MPKLYASCLIYSLDISLYLDQIEFNLIQILEEVSGRFELI